MAAQHTPAPWRKATEQEQLYGDRWVIGPVGEIVLSYAGCGSHKMEISEADLAVVLAAPALADALEALIPVAVEWGSRGAQHAALDAARTALRAAGRLP